MFSRAGSALPLALADDAAEAPPISDHALLDRIIPLWVGLSRGGEARPTLRFGDEVMTAANARWCAGRWQLHVFSFASEARIAQQTLAMADLHAVCEAGVRASGEGLLLLRETDSGRFGCVIVDRRRTRDAPAPVGSWQVAHDLGLRAALHVPDRSAQRAEAAIRDLRAEFDDPDQWAEFVSRLGGRPTERPLASIDLRDVVEAANRILEPVGAEIACSDREILSVIDSYLAGLSIDVEGHVDRIAHELLAEVADKGGIG